MEGKLEKFRLQILKQTHKMIVLRELPYEIAKAYARASATVRYSKSCSNNYSIYQNQLKSWTFISFFCVHVLKYAILYNI